MFDVMFGWFRLLLLLFFVLLGVIAFASGLVLLGLLLLPLMLWIGWNIRRARHYQTEHVVVDADGNTVVRESLTITTDYEDVTEKPPQSQA